MPNSADLQGRGSGMGRYQGSTLDEIRVTFDRCLEDRSMRSVRAILRITREQLDARGSLGSYPYLAVGLITLSLLAFLAAQMIPNLPEQFRALEIGLPITALMVLFGVWHARHDRRAGVAQEKEIRRMGATALSKLVEYDFPRKSLEREHVMTLQDLIRREPRPGLQQLLEDTNRAGQEVAG